MKKLLNITKIEDKTLPLFLTYKIQQIIDIQFLYVTEPVNHIEDIVKNNSFDYIYLRAPFYAGIDNNQIKEICNIALKYKKSAYMVDNITSDQDVFLEDKWYQYKLLNNFMPKTELLNQKTKKQIKNKIIKKRLSSLARDIYFSIPDTKALDDFIIQDKLDIATEYRVFSIFGNVLTLAETKSPKTELQKVKVQKPIEISKELESFTYEIDKQLNFDFVGYDIAETKDGEFKLLEANRSCFFAGYYKLTGVNLAEIFIDELIKK